MWLIKRFKSTLITSFVAAHVLIIALMLSPVSAEVVGLISGKTIKGTIVSRDEKMIKIDIGAGYPLAYFLDEIYTIDGAIVATPEPEPEIQKHEEPIVELAPIAIGNTADDIHNTARPVLPKDVATVNDVNLYKSLSSPASIKPKELLAAKKVLEITRSIEVDSAMDAIESLDASKKLPFIQQRLQAIPVKVRRAILILFSALIGIAYVLLCFPLMLIAQKFGKKHIWLIWIPIVQIFYLLSIARRPFWWVIFLAIPIVNIFAFFILCLDILKLLRKPLGFIFLLMIPGINILTLWYLALSALVMK